MTDRPGESDYAALLRDACRIAAQTHCVIHTLLEADTFADRRPTLVDLYLHETAVNQALNSLRTKSAGELRNIEDPHSIADYLICIRSIGWHDFMLATASFARAALHRFLFLLDVAPEAFRQSFAALIVHQEAYVAIVEELALSSCGAKRRTTTP